MNTPQSSEIAAPVDFDAYVRAGGQVCPKCGAPDIEGGSVEIDGNVAWLCGQFNYETKISEKWLTLSGFGFDE